MNAIQAVALMQPHRTTVPVETEAQRKAKLDEVKARVTAASPEYKATLAEQRQAFLNRNSTQGLESFQGESA